LLTLTSFRIFIIKGENTDNVKNVLLKDSNWVAPILWRSEFRSVLSHYLRKEYLSMSQANYLIGEAESLMLGSEYHVLSSEVLDMLLKTNLSVYDCEFVALAKELGTHLITSDKKILKEAPEIALTIKDYLSLR